MGLVFERMSPVSEAEPHLMPRSQRRILTTITQFSQIKESDRVSANDFSFSEQIVKWSRLPHRSP
jgi:hypothetical protein